MSKIRPYYIRIGARSVLKYPVSQPGRIGPKRIRQLLRDNASQIGLPPLSPDSSKKPIIVEVRGGRYEVFDSREEHIKYFAAQFEACDSEQQYIRSFVIQFEFKNIDSAIINIETMVEGMSEGKKGETNYRKKFLAEVLPYLIVIAQEQKKDLDISFARLANIGRFYDVAGKSVSFSYSPISQNIFQKDKYFLFKTLCNDPESFANLFERKLMKFASTFRYIAKFSCRLLLFAMFELPRRTRRLTRLTIKEAKIQEVGGEKQFFYDERVREKRMGEMRSYIADNLRRIEKRVSSEDADLLFHQQIDFLRKYSQLGLVRIACVYLREFIDSDLRTDSSDFGKAMFEAAKKNMQLIYDEMSNLSHVLLRFAYSIAQRRTEAAHGKPLKEFACPEKLKSAIPELAAANRTLRRHEDHLVRKGMAAVHKTPKERFARLHELLLAYRDRFNKINIAERGVRRQPIAADLTGRIWKSLSNEERSSLKASFSKTKTTAAVGLVNYLFGVYGYMRMSRVAFLMGGANARKEYPSFDYDCIFIYEADGRTTRGSTNEQYFQDFHKYLETAVRAMGHNFDSAFSPFKKGPGTFQALSDYFAKRDYDSYQTARGFSVLAYGAGDRTFASHVINEIYKFVFDSKTVPVLLDIRCREFRQSRSAGRDDDDPEDAKRNTINIKYHPGGLRDIAFLYWIYKLKRNSREVSVFKALEQIIEEYGPKLPEKDRPEATRLIESYEFLMNMRIRLDLYVGRNDKDIPDPPKKYKDSQKPSKEEIELTKFAESLGCNREEFEADLKKHRVRISYITEKLIDLIIRS